MYAPIDVIFDSIEVGTSQVGGSRDNPTFNLLPAIEQCVGIAVTYANVPFTYFVIDNTCNTFTIIDSLAVSRLVTLVPGSYNSVNIVTQLRSAILKAGYVDTLEIFVDSTTSKLVIYKTSNIAAPFTIQFTTAETDLARLLGFPVGSTVSTTADVVNDSDVILTGRSNLSGTNVVNLSGPSQMFLDSDLGASIFGSVRNQAGNRNLLGFWPVNSNYQGTVEYVNMNPEMIPMTAKNLSRLNLSLTIGNRPSYNAKGVQTSYLQLNGEPFQIGLRFWVKVKEGVEVADSLGNRSIQVQSDPRLYNPKRLKKSNMF